MWRLRDGALLLVSLAGCGADPVGAEADGKGGLPLENPYWYLAAGPCGAFGAVGHPRAELGFTDDSGDPWEAGGSAVAWDGGTPTGWLLFQGGQKGNLGLDVELRCEADGVYIVAERSSAGTREGTSWSEDRFDTPLLLWPWAAATGDEWSTVTTGTHREEQWNTRNYRGTVHPLVRAGDVRVALEERATASDGAYTVTHLQTDGGLFFGATEILIADGPGIVGATWSDRSLELVGVRMPRR